MAYATTNPPRLRSYCLGIEFGKVYTYMSTDSAATVNTAGYFSNGWELGMRLGDIVDIYEVDDAQNPTTLTAVTRSYVNAASESGGVDVVDGTALAATDTD